MMNWLSLLNCERFGVNSEDWGMDVRTPFHKDHDRVIFSSAFRRLERKTQVHPLSDNDHVHSRLTHSLETSCVGRSLGSLLGERLGSELPSHISPMDIGAIIQAACLAHDIGNPPFGHTGEDAIRQWFLDQKNASYLNGLDDAQIKDMQTFEGNAQGFRVLTQLEYHRFDGGMRLTYATLGSFLKYPWHSGYQDPAKGAKFGAYQSELPFLEQIANKLGLIQVGTHRYCRHPLVYLMEAADDICYAIIDLEDGVEMGLLDFNEVADLLLQFVGADVPSAYFDMHASDPAHRRLAILRGKAMEKMVNSVCDVFLDNKSAIMEGTFEGDLISKGDPELSDCIQKAKQTARCRIFNDPKKALVEIGAYTTLGSLLEAFISAANEAVVSGKAGFRSQRILDLMGRHAPQPGWDHYRAYLRVMDYISGMTDGYAVDLAQAIRGLRH